MPGTHVIDIILPQEKQGSQNPINDIKHALHSSLGFSWENLKAIRSVAIGINDKTRPVPHDLLLPPLLELLKEKGIAPGNIHLIIASGTHQPMKSDEYVNILPQDIIANYSISVHDCDNSPLELLGNTSRGTPVLVNRDFYTADFKITVGNIEPHHFMGYSGGVKTASIGLTGRQTINKNHSLITHPCAITGHFDDNPMRQDVEEIGKIIGVDYVVNAILNSKKEIIRVITGNPGAVMVSGIQFSRKINQVKVKERYALVIVAPGGYPKDINFYQSQKALTHAGLITKIGGDILLIAECIEGVGSADYENFMQSVTSHADVMATFTKNKFAVGPHKAYLVSRDGLTKNIHLYSCMPETKVRQLLLDPVQDLQTFIEHFLSNIPQNSRIAILPNGSTTIPLITL